MNQLFEVIMRQVSLWQLRLDLCAYDTLGKGELQEHDMQTYIADRIGMLPQLRKLDAEFFETYTVYGRCSVFAGLFSTQ